jgi:hypothetical protein
MIQIAIELADDRFQAVLTPDRSPETVRAIAEALPIEAVASKWGDEFYFEIPVTAEEENARSPVSVGDLAYWPAGRCFCIFYGPTPMSGADGVPVPASPVNVIGRIEDIERLREHVGGETVRILRAED